MASGKSLEEIEAAIEKFQGQRRWSDVVRQLQLKSELMEELPAKIAVLVEAAELLVEKANNQSEALKVWDKVLGLDSSHERARSEVRALAERRHDWQRVVQVMRLEAEQVEDPGAKLVLLEDIARLATEKLRRPDACTEAWEAVLAADERHDEALEQLAALYKRTRTYDKLATVLATRAEALTDDASLRPVLQELALLYGDKLEQPRLAVETYRRLLLLDPNDRRAQEQLKRRLVSLADWAELEAFYAVDARWDEFVRLLEREAEREEHAVELREDAHRRLARVWIEEKARPERSVKHFERMLALDPSCVEAAEALLPTYREAGKLEPWVAVLDVLSASSRPDADALAREAASLVATQGDDLAAAAERYGRLLERLPEDAEVLAAYTDAASSAKTQAEAVPRLEKLAGAAAGETQAALSVAQGRMLLALDRNEEAVTLLEQTLKRFDGYGPALAELSDALKRVGRFDAIEPLYRDRLANEDEPEARAGIMLELAKTLAGPLERPVDAETTLREVVAIAAEPATLQAAWQALVALGRDTEKWELSAEAYEALAEQVEEPEARANYLVALGRLCAERLGAPERALDTLEVLDDTLLAAHVEAIALLDTLLGAETVRLSAARRLVELPLEGEQQALIARAWRVRAEVSTDVDEQEAAWQALIEVERDAGDTANAEMAFQTSLEALAAVPASEPIYALAQSLALDATRQTALVNALVEVAAKSESEQSAALKKQAASLAELALEDSVRAFELYREVASAGTGDVEASGEALRLAEQLERWGDFVTLSRLVAAQREAAGEQREFLVRAGEVAKVELADEELAVRLLQEAVDADPESIEAARALAALHRDRKAWSELGQVLELCFERSAQDDERIRTLYELAVLRVEALSDVEGAVQALRDLITLDPTHEDALKLLERLMHSSDYVLPIAEVLEPVYRNEGRFDALLTLYRKQLEAVVDPEGRLAIFLRIAETAELGLSDAQAAFDASAEALREELEPRVLMEHVERYAMDLGSMDAVVALYAECAAEFQDPVLAAELYARAAHIAANTEDDAERGAALYRKALEKDPTQESALNELQSIYEFAGKHAELAEILRAKGQAAEDPLTRREALLRAGSIYEEQLADFASACDVYALLFEAEPEDLEVIDKVIEMQLLLDRWDDVLEVYSRRLDLLLDAEEKKRTLVEIGIVHEHELLNLERAIDTYQQILELDPGDAAAMVRLDALYQSSENWAELLSVLEQRANAAQSEGERHAHLFRIAELWRQQLGEALRALDIYQELLAALGQHAPTQTALEHMLADEVELSRVAMLLQPLYEGRGDWESAAKVLWIRAQNEEDPVERLELLTYLAQVEDLQLNRDEDAFEHYLQAALIDPENESVLESLRSVAERADKQTTLGERLLEAAKTTQATDGRAAAALARVSAGAFLAADPDSDAAVASLQLLLSLDGTDAEALAQIARLYERQQRWEPMVDVMRRQLDLETDPDAELSLRFRMAQAQERCLADYPGAIDTYGTILEIAPDHDPARSALEMLVAERVELPRISAVLEPLYRAQADWAKLAFLGEALLGVTTDQETRATQMRALADLQRDGLGNDNLAFRWLQRALLEAPEDELLAEDVVQFADALDGWTQLSDTYVNIVHTTSSMELRTQYGLRLAGAYLQQLGDAYRAEASYRYVLSVSPGQIEALEALEGIYRESDAHQALANVLEQRVRVEEDPIERAQSLSRFGECQALALGDYDAAIKAYEQLLSLDGADTEDATRWLKRLHAKKGDWQGYVAALGREVADTLDEAERSALLEETALVESHYLVDRRSAIRSLREVLDLQGDTPETLNALGQLYAADDNWQDLADVLEREATVAHDDVHRVAVLADLARLWEGALKRERNAQEAWERVLDIDPGHVEALKSLANNYRRSAMTFELVDTLTRLTAAGDPERHAKTLADAYAELGQLYAGEELAQPQDAIDSYRSALEHDPTRLSVLDGLEALYVASEQWDGLVEVKLQRGRVLEDGRRAVTELEEAASIARERLEDISLEHRVMDTLLKRQPSRSDVFARAVTLKRQLHMQEEVVNLFMERIERSEKARERAQLLRDLADVYEADLSDLDGALQALAMAWAESYRDVETPQKLEAFAREHERWNEVLDVANGALEQVEDAQERIALCLACARWYGQELARPEYALPYYEQIMALDAQNLDAARQMVELYRVTQQWQSMGETLTRVVELSQSPEDKALALVELGILCSQELQLYEQAEAYYAQALRLDPNNVPAATALEPIYRERSQWAQVKDMLERQVANQSASEDWYQASLRLGGLLEAEFNDAAYAAQIYEAAVVYKPTDVETVRALERSLSAEQRWRELAELYDRVVEHIPIERGQVRALVAGAEVWREHFLNAEEAVARFERALEIDPASTEALEGLVEVQRKRGDWSAAIDALERRVQSTTDREEQARWYREVGALARDGLEDLDRALDAYLAALDREGDSEDTLSALTQLYAKLGDYSGARDMLSERIRLAQDKGSRNALRVELGELLMQHLEDEEGAIEVFQSILDEEPGQLGAMQALRELYTRRCDWHTVARLLGEEAAQHEAPRLAARTLIELGEVYQQRLGDEANAKRAFEEALALDEGAVGALAPLADFYVRDNALERAKSVLERLVPSLTGQAEADELAFYARLWGRVETELGNPALAVKAYGQAQSLGDESLETLLGLGRAQQALEAWEPAFKCYQAVLVHFRDELMPEARADVFFSLGQIKLAQGEKRKALNMYEKVLDDAPDHREALAAIIEIYESGQQWNQVISYLERSAEVVAPEESAAFLLRAGDVWMQELKNLPRAADAYQQAVDLDPSDQRALHKLLVAVQQQRDWPRTVDVIRSIAEIEERPAARAKYIYTVGVIYRDELKTPDDAARAFMEALEIDASQLKIFESINKLMTQRQDWKGLERAYRRMLHQTVGQGAPELIYELWHGLGLIYRDRLQDYNAAAEAFGMALQAKPELLDERKILAELYEALPGRETDAIGMHEGILRQSPQRLKSYTSLLRLHAKQGNRATAGHIAHVLRFLGQAEGDVVALAEARPIKSVLEAKGQLTTQAWLHHVAHPDEDLFLGKLLEAVVPAVLSLRAASDKQLGLLKKHYVDPETSTVLMARIFKALGQRLGVGIVPRLFARSDVQGALAIIPGSNPPAMIAGSALLSGRTPAELAFFLGMQLAYFRPERFLRTQVSTNAEIKPLLLGALALAGVAPAEGQAGEVAQQLAQGLLPPQREALTKVGKKFMEERQGRANVKAWLRGLEFTAARAGLIACGDIAVAANVIQSLPSAGPNDPPAAEKLADLLAYAASSDYAAARAALGL